MLRFVFGFSKILSLSFAILFMFGCTGSSPGIIDNLLGGASNTPILSTVSNQTIAQESTMKVDVNNVKKGEPGDDSGMTYTCQYDNVVDNSVDAGASNCTDIPNSTTTFDPAAGLLTFTPHAPLLGNYEIKITGTNQAGSASVIFTVGVRLNFQGITSLSQITGTSVTINWNANTSATGYQIFKYDNNIGNYALLQNVSGGATSGYNLTGLSPNTGYVLRVEAVDELGNLDGNTVSKSFTTTSLTKFALSPTTATTAAGTPLAITVQSYDANGVAETVGGLQLTPQITAGGSLGNFSGITDNGDGTYSFTFTPTIVSTAIDIGISMTSSFFLINTTHVTVIPGSANSANSTIAVSSSPVVSGNSVNISANIFDIYNNPIATSSAVSFVASGGTSTGTISNASNQGGGNYTATFTGITAGTAENLYIKVNGVTLTPSASIQVVPGTPSSISSTISVSSPTVASNSTVTVTAVLKDINGNPVTSGVVVAFNKSGGTSTGTFDSVTNAGNGVYTTTYTGVLAGTSQTLSVSADGVTLAPTATIQVVPGPANLANSTLTVSSPTITSGSFVTLTATLKDANSNLISSGITVGFSASGGTSTGTITNLTNQGSGVYTAKYNGVVAGTAQTVIVTVNGVNLGASVSIQVLPGSPDATKSTITVSAPSVVSGNTVTITETIKDLNSNTISSGVTVGVTATGGTSSGTLGTTNNVGNGVYTTTYTGVAAGTAQTLSLTISGAPLGPTATIVVNPGALNSSNSSFVTTNTTVTSGTAETITATLRDVNNNPVAGTIAFTKSGGTSTATFGSTINQGNGVYTVTYTGVVAGTAQTIGVTINGVDSGLGLNETVIPGAPNSTKSSITVSSATVVSGNSVTVTATLEDLNSNPISSGITVGITASGGTSTGTLGTVNNNGNGTYSTTYTGIVSGSAQTLNVTVANAPLGPSTSITVLPGSLNATNSSLVTTNSTVVSGTTVTITATLLDVNSNPISGTVAFTKTGGTSTGTFGSTINQGNGVYSVTYTGNVAGTSQTIGVTINTVASGLTLNETVVPGAPAASKSSITVSSATVISGSSVTVTATLKDLNSNPVSSGNTVGITATGGTSTGTLGTVVNNGDGTYSTTYTGIVSGSAQTLNVTVAGASLGPSTSITVLSGALNATNSSLVTTNTTVVSGTTATITATLLDVNSNPVTGAVAFTKTGGTSTGVFGTAVNLGGGVYTVNYTGTLAGSAQTIGVTIAGNDSGLSTTETVVNASPDLSKSTITVSAPTVVSNNTVTITATIKDLNGNTISSGVTVGITATNGSSTGTLGSITNAGNGVYTSTYTGLVAGSAQTLNITIAGAPLGPTTSITVTPGPINLTKSSLTTTSTALTSGSTVTLTATILDINSNPVSGTIAFTKTGGTSTGNFGTIVSVGNGVYTMNYTGVTAGSAQTMGVTISGVDSGLSTTETVSNGAPDASKSTLTVSSGTVTSNNSVTVTATIKDANSNVISSGYTVGITATGGTSTGNISSITNVGSGVYTALYTGVNAGTAQTLNITIAGTALGPTTTIAVNAGPINLTNSTLTTTNATIASGSAATIVATFRDINNNPISGTIAFTKVGGTSTGNFSTATNPSSGVYSTTYTGVVAGTAQTIGITLNGTDSGLSLSEAVTPGAPDATKSSITVSSATVTSGSSVTITATVKDTANNTISSGVTVAVNATGGTSTGAISSITNVGSGVYTATYTGVNAGSAQTLSLYTSGTALGPTTTITVNAGSFYSVNSTLTTTSSTVISGQTATISATLRDTNNNPVSGTIAFTKTGGTSTGTFGTMVNQGGGVYTITYTGVAAGTAQTIGVTINGTDSGLSAIESVIPGAPDSTKSTITVSSASVVSGSSVTVTATLKDLNSNTISSGVTVGITASGGSSTGTLGSITNNGDGTYTTGYLGVTAGTAQTLNVTTGGSNLGPTTTITVTPGGLNSSNSSFVTTSATLTSGTSATITATLRDVNGNPVTGAVAFTKTGGTSTGNFSAVTNQGGGVYTATYSGVVAGTAQTLGVTIATVDSGMSLTETVTPAAPDSTKSTITISSATVVSGNSVTISATLKDLNSNLISTGAAIGITATGGTSTGTIGSITNAGSGVYTTTYTGINAGTAQTINLQISSSNLGPSTSVTVSAGGLSLANSSLVTSTATVISGTSATITATLRDVNNNPVVGAVAFTKTGGTSTGTLSAATSQGAGVYTATYAGTVAGTAQTIGVTIAGVDSTMSLTETVTPAAPDSTKSTITVSAGTVVSGSSVTVTATLKDLNSNLISSGVTVGVTATGGTSTGTIAAITNAGSGVYTTTYTGVTAGSAQTLNITINSTSLGPTTTVAVSAGGINSGNSSLVTTSATLNSGTQVTITATLRDVNSNPVVGAVAFTKTGGTSTGTFGSILNQGGGVYTVTYLGVAAGTAQTIGVTIAGADSGMNVTETVNAAAPDSTKSTITVSSATVVSGNSVTITATVRDLNSNPISSGVSVGIVASGGSSTGTLGSITNAGSGAYTTTYTGIVAGSAQTINITIGGTNLGPTTSITVNAGPLNSGTSSLVTTNTFVTSGTSVTITATLLDVNNNPVTGAVAFTKSGGTSTGTFGTASNQGGGVYTVTYSGLVAGTAQTIGVTIATVDSGMSISETVVAAAPDYTKSTITVSSATVVSGNSVTVTANVKDLNSNPISSGVTVGIAASGGSSTGTIGSITNAGSGTYTTTYTGVVAGTAQTLNITIGGTNLGPTTSITVNAGPMNSGKSSLVTTNASVTSGTSVTITATLLDVNSNPVTGAVAFTKTGGTSTGNFGTTVSQGAGVYTVTYAGVVAGTAQTIGVTIATVDSGMSLSETVTAAAPDSSKSTLTVSSATVSSGSSVTVTATLKDLNSNLISSGYTVGIVANGGTSTGTIGSIVNGGNGVYTTTYAGVVSGSAQTLNIQIGGSNLGPTATITVNPGSLNGTTSSLVTTNTTVVSGTTVTITATLRDVNSNPVSGAIAFTKANGTSTGTFGTAVNQGAGVYTVTYTGIVAGTAQTIGVTIAGVDSGMNVNETVTNGSPDPTKSSISVANASVKSGATDTITATILDSNSNPISSGITVTFSKTGGSSTGTFGSVTNLGAGQYSIVYTGVVAGTAQTIGISIGGSNLGPTTSISVTAGDPSGANSTLSLSASSVVSGQNVTMTATILDSNSNPISSGLTVTFGATGGSSTGTISAVTNQGNGVYTATYAGVTAGTSQTVQTKIAGVNFGPTSTIQVTVGAPVSANSSISIVSSPVQSGNSATITAVVKDVNNNPITTEYVISFDSINGTSTGTIGSVTNGGGGSFSTTYTGVNAGTAQTVRVLSNSAPISGLTGSITVTPGAVNAANSTFSIAAASVQSGTSTTMSMSMRDAANNTISSGLTISFNQSTGTSSGTISSVTNNGNGSYSATYTGTTQGSAETITLVANGTAVSALTVSVTVLAGPPTQMAITGPANPLNSIDCNGPYTIALQDASGNPTSSSQTVTMALSATPTNAQVGTLFSEGSCTSAVTSFTFGVAVPTQIFYYKSYTPQTMVLTLTPTPNSIAPNTVTITNSQVLSWIGSAANFVMNGTGPTYVADDTLGGLTNPYDVHVDGNYLYVADNGANRILKYNISTNTLVGWIGHVGITENMAAYDGSNSCSGLAIGALTPVWCTGGRSNVVTAAIINGPKYITGDPTYLYVTVPNSSRILRFAKADGSYQGWIGRIASTSGLTPAACVSAGVNAAAPTWCFGSTATTGTIDGALNNPQGINYNGGYLYVADYGNIRIQKFNASTGAPGGWVGNVNVAPGSSGQLATCSPLPTSGQATPGWCLSVVTGTAQTANRNNLSTSPSEVLAPSEGWYNPTSVTSDSTYLYVGDASNGRVVRINLSTGAFSGWIGNNVTRSLAGNQPSVAPGTGGYTSTWTTGGQTSQQASTYGFGTIRGLAIDSTYLYISDDYSKVSRVSISNGQGFVWLGRTSTSPTGGYTGCSSTPVSGVTPGWCLGGAGNKLGNTNSAFYNPYGLAVSGSELFVADVNNFRVQRFNLSQGYFDGWIGATPNTATTWTRTLSSSLTAARWGIDDYSSGDISTVYNSLAITPAGNLFQTDYAFNRIKKFNALNGSIIGYMGLINVFPPTGGADCVGFTSGITPDWCTGGGRTTSGSGIGGFNNPYALAADSTYVYVTNYSNNRIDRVRIADALYLGWIGDVSTTPTDGSSACTSTGAGTATPNWCIGGLAQASNLNGMFNGPRAIYFDPAGLQLYASDNTGRLMSINTSNGSFAGVIGNVGASPVGCTQTSSIANGWCTSGTGGGATNNYGGVNGPSGIATNSTYIFVADSSTHRILRFNKSTGAPAGFIGKMTNTTNLNVTVATGGACASFTGTPKATPGWCFGTAVGVGLTTQTGTEDNAFNTPRSVWADDNYLYVSDTGNNRIVKIDANTGVNYGWKGLIGSTTATFAMTDATCIAAGAGAITPKWCNQGTSAPGKFLGEFDNPTGIVGDANYIYVLDSHNNRTITVPRN